MTVTVKHPFVSTVPDDADTSLVRPSNWNADHTIIGLGTAAEKDVGVANGVASLDGSGTVPISQLPSAVLGALNYQGTWNANTNTPTLTSSVGTKGYYYVVNVAGNTNLNGVTDWQIGDWAVYNGTAWQKIDNTDAVTSVNGFTGTVVLTTTNIAEGTNEYFTTAKARSSLSAGTGINYSTSTGVITNSAPDQTVVLNAGTGISTSGTYPNFTITNTSPSLGGDVVGPASATDNAIARFDTTTGKLIQNSVVTVSDTGGIAGATTITDINYVDFNTAYSTTLGAGQLGWDGNNTLGLGMSGGNIVQEIGLQTFIYGKASSAITKGQLIKKTGANGTSGVITFAPTTANMTNSGDVIGIAAETIALNGFGYIMSTGNLRGFNTTGSSSGETWADGDTLYYNPAGNGLMTNVKPSAPNIKTEVGIVTNAGSGGSGSVVVEIIHGSQLGGTDSNVQTNGVTGGQLLSYDQTNGYWKNTSLTAGTGITVSPATSGTITVTNAGVTQATAGTGISVSAGTGNVTITNTGVTSAVAGTGISVSGSTGAVTVTNTAPDQTVAISAGTGISVTGTYPNFTVTNTAPSSGGTVTSVTGTSPVVSSGGNTPAISLASGYGDTLNPYASKTANFVLAAPNGSAGVPTFRAIVAADIPTLNQNTTGTASNVTGTVAVANGGTGLTSLTANRIPYGNGTSAYQSSANLTFNGTTLVATDITDSSLTSGRVTYAGTAGNLVDSSSFTFDGTTQTAPIQRASNGIVTNSKTIATSYTIPSTDNAMSAGPVTINSGVTVTVASGSRWVVL